MVKVIVPNSIEAVSSSDFILEIDRLLTLIFSDKDQVFLRIIFSNLCDQFFKRGKQDEHEKSAVVRVVRSTVGDCGCAVVVISSDLCSK